MDLGVYLDKNGKRTFDHKKAVMRSRLEITSGQESLIMEKVTPEEAEFGLTEYDTEEEEMAALDRLGLWEKDSMTAAIFKESEHPRDEGGKFGTGGTTFSNTFRPPAGAKSDADGNYQFKFDNYTISLKEGDDVWQQILAQKPDSISTHRQWERPAERIFDKLEKLYETEPKPKKTPFRKLFSPAPGMKSDNGSYTVRLEYDGHVIKPTFKKGDQVAGRIKAAIHAELHDVITDQINNEHDITANVIALKNNFIAEMKKLYSGDSLQAADFKEDHPRDEDVQFTDGGRDPKQLKSGHGYHRLKPDNFNPTPAMGQPNSKGEYELDVPGENIFAKPGDNLAHMIHERAGDNMEDRDRRHYVDNYLQRIIDKYYYEPAVTKVKTARFNKGSFNPPNHIEPDKDGVYWISAYPHEGSSFAPADGEGYKIGFKEGDDMFAVAYSHIKKIEPKDMQERYQGMVQGLTSGVLKDIKEQYKDQTTEKRGEDSVKLRGHSL
ncbi:hypothetical protein CENSYa_0650 [Cenarchaeum symbiosum A]|uniref:Uncharacterized protein n=1 Tax=Cenarchaeum symbiosum (strain A) TaxID=414004 RepID=A0RVB6_CENSY|nr:hypothetical protein CENSYa_0650 [Cenarchaeum symbiosum A]